MLYVLQVYSTQCHSQTIGMVGSQDLILSRQLSATFACLFMARFRKMKQTFSMLPQPSRTKLYLLLMLPCDLIFAVVLFEELWQTLPVLLAYYQMDISSASGHTSKKHSHRDNISFCINMQILTAFAVDVSLQFDVCLNRF